MQSLDAREKSFGRNWPHKRFKANSKSLARAGFFLKATPELNDNVECYLCQINLSSWQSKQEPMVRHMESSADCPIVRLKLAGLSWIERVHAGEFAFDKAHGDSPWSQAMTHARQQTFGTWWPHEDSQSCTSEKVSCQFSIDFKMAMAGFIYSPEQDSDDKAECIYCNLALDGWEKDDDPVKEHSKRAPTCPFFDDSQFKTVPKKQKGRSKKAGKSTENVTDEASLLDQPSMVSIADSTEQSIIGNDSVMDLDFKTETILIDQTMNTEAEVELDMNPEITDYQLPSMELIGKEISRFIQDNSHTKIPLREKGRSLTVEEYLRRLVDFKCSQAETQFQNLYDYFAQKSQELSRIVNEEANVSF